MTHPQGLGPPRAAAVDRMCVLAAVSRGAYYRGWGHAAPAASDVTQRSR
jgi:hypothetical protein